MLGFLKKKTPEQESEKGYERQASLNIIYFIDSHKTHSLKIPVRRAYWVVGAILSVLLWSFVGSGLLLRELYLNDKQSERLQNFANIVFQYQTRYDDVYEKAYPKGTKTAPPVAKSNQNPKTPEKSDDKTVKLAAKTPPASEADKEEAPDRYPVAVEDVKHKLKGSSLVVSYNLRNIRKPTLSSGTLWGAITIETAEGKKYLTAPTGVQVNSDGEAPGFRGGYRFSIRYFNSRSITFAIPQDIKGTINDLKFFVSVDGDKDHTASFPINISIEGRKTPVVVAPPAPKPAETAKLPAAEEKRTPQSLDAAPKPTIWKTPQEAAKPQSADAVPGSAARKNLTPNTNQTDNKGIQTEPIPETTNPTDSTESSEHDTGLEVIEEDHPAEAEGHIPSDVDEPE